MAYIFAVLAMISIGTLGLLSKLADQRKYEPSTTTILLFGSASVIMAVDVLAIGNAHFAPPPKVIIAGVGFGILAVLAFWVFLFGLKFGKITTSWVFINLSAAVPALLSTILYHEKLGSRKICLLGLVVASILLLWKDRMEIADEERRNAAAAADRYRTGIALKPER